MVAFDLLRASLALFTLLAPATLASPTPSSLVTPFGERPAENVHAVPEGNAIRHDDDEKTDLMFVS